MRKKLVWFAVMLVSLLMVFSAASAATMTMPDGLKVIDVEAFYGDKSISTVVLPSGITEIRARAFANSALREMNLPDSLTYIADDALPSPTQLQVTATKGTYAYRWADAHGYLAAAPVQLDLATSFENTTRKITVSWTAFDGATSYKVYYGKSTDVSAATEIANITGTSCVIDANLQAGTTYYTWVKAVTASGDSRASNIKNVLTYPAAPTVKDPVISGNTVTLSWNAVQSATRYNLRYDTRDDYQKASFGIIGITGTSYMITGLEFNTKYYIWVEAFNESGGVVTGKSKDVTTQDDQLTPKQSEPEGGLKKVTVYWSAVEDAESYNVYYGTSLRFSDAKKIPGLTGTSHTIPDLKSGTTYYTWVTAMNASKESNVSNRRSALTYPAAPVLKDPAVSGNMVTLSWDAVPTATSYYVRWGTENNYSKSERSPSLTENSYTITGMEFNTKYYIWMLAYNESGGVRTTNYKEITTGDDTRTPKAPEQDDPKGGQMKVTVKWTAVDGAESYNVYYGTSASFAAAKKISSVTGTSREVTGLECGTIYYTWVSAVQGGKESLLSNRKSVITKPEVAVLGTPVVSGNSITFTWEKATGAVLYYLQYGTTNNFSEATKTENTAETTYTITGLEYDTTYYVWPVTGNASGWIYPPSPVTVKTGAAPQN